MILIGEPLIYYLLSALAQAPIRQLLAATGSVNQHGEVQAIGGVNEKIEGFLDICNQRGLRQQAEARLGAQHVDIDFITLPDETVQSLLEKLTALNTAALIIERNNLLLDSPAFRQGMDSLDCSLLLVR